MPSRQDRAETSPTQLLPQEASPAAGSQLLRTSSGHQSLTAPRISGWPRSEHLDLGRGQVDILGRPSTVHGRNVWVLPGLAGAREAEAAPNERDRKQQERGSHPSSPANRI